MPNWLHRKEPAAPPRAPLKATQSRRAPRSADDTHLALVGATLRPGDRLALKFAGPSRRTITVAGPAGTITEDMAAEVAATALAILARVTTAQEVTP